MIKLFLKITSYLILLLLALEGLVRFFHLAKDTPQRFIDHAKVEKWVPNQTGISVTGIRRQNSAKYRINTNGFNSYREFDPSKETFELALVGDSFIQGFHQDYDNSIGKKIENVTSDINVFEYGYAGYDFADQIHLIHAYKNDFDLIDAIVIYIDFNTDLKRGTYQVIEDRVALQSPLNNILKKCKLLVYIKSIGLLDPPKKIVANVINCLKSTTKVSVKDQQTKKVVDYSEVYMENFKKLIHQYGFEKQKSWLLLNSNTTPKVFLDYLHSHHFKVIDFYQEFKNATKPTFLIYDQHWNNYGRSLIAKQISESIDH
ncbi:hypothetical protein [Aquimarina agarivorans]|uniref:hypothetical protein n=1 Tax=Aquimarina agarivorans TaxID=980584 RepID=UPI0004979941|nr:hypothetical protein [Aquimarina agarivorans]